MNRNSQSLQTEVEHLVNECIQLESSNQIPELQERLYEMYQYFNKPNGGRLIIDFPNKSNLATCFSFLLQYDWIGDSDLREVWAEDGFYCIVNHIQHQNDGMRGQCEAMIILFMLLCVGRDSLLPKVQDILDKARIRHNPIFHMDDYENGAQLVINQFAFMAASGARQLGPDGQKLMSIICKRYNGFLFFVDTIQNTELMKSSPISVFNKMKFVAAIIESILEDI